MQKPTASIGEQLVIQARDLARLLDALRGAGYQVVGPTARAGAIVYDELAATADLPVGWTDAQDGGSYRLTRRADGAFFGYAVGPHAWKKYLHPARVRLWQAERAEGSFQIVAANDAPPKLAFIGVRACELHAIAIQDRVLLGGAYVDPLYKARRENIFVVAVNCAHAGGTCFCVSTHTGPQVPDGFDLALTEILDGDAHYFVTQVGTARGAELLAAAPFTPARETEKEAAARVVAKTVEQMGRTLDTRDLKELFYRNYDHPAWDEVATRCLTCANCTLVCPTCFCTTVEDMTDLSGARAERWRQWDSCFTMEFSYIHGGSIRASARARYRQWLTHKLATWQDQFGTSGCVGCGRCITWCPVGIDLTAQVRAIREK